MKKSIFSHYYVLFRYYSWLSYGTKCVRRIVTNSMSYFLHLCDFSLPYCANLEAWNWFVAGHHLNASHPKSLVWQIKMSLYFQAIIFGKTVNGHYYSTIRDFDLIPKVRARLEYQLSSSTIYTAWLASAFPPDINHP